MFQANCIKHFLGRTKSGGRCPRVHPVATCPEMCC